MPTDNAHDVSPAAAASSAVGGLKAYLLGTWTLESYVEVDESGLVLGRPFGSDAQGMLIYAPDGFMSVFLMPTNRQPFASGDWFSPTPAELQDASRVVIYSGRYSVDEGADLVIHDVALSFFPNWCGKAQVRRIERAAGRLVLAPEKSLCSDGKLAWPRLTWVRPSPQD